MTTYNLKISGMTCGGCSMNLMSKMLERFPESKFSADHVSGSGVLICEPEKFSAHLALIKSLGFKARTIETHVKGSETFKLIALAVTFVCFGNVMIFAAAEYFAEPGEIDSDFITLFRSCSALLTTISLAFGCRELFRNSTFALKNRKASVDLAIGAALLVAYGFSLTSLVNQSIAPFFDSIVATVFLMNLGRFFQHRFLNRQLQKVDQLKREHPTFTRRIVNNDESTVDVCLIKKGDYIRVLPGEILSLDAKLLTSRATVSLDLITGEVDSQVFNQQMLIPAGAVCLSREFTAEAMQDGTDSPLQALKWQSFELSMQKTRLSQWSDRTASYFYLVIITLAFCCLLYSWHLGLNAAISRFVAILLVACPCAFAVAIPIAILRGATTAAKNGILFKNAAALQNLASCRIAIFDKTGTLSDLNLEVKSAHTPIPLTPEQKNILFNAVKRSSHPASQALHRYLAQNEERNLFTDLEVDAEEIFGSGLIIKYNDLQLRLGSSAFTNLTAEHMDLYLASADGSMVAAFQLSETQAPGLESCVIGLEELHLPVTVLSGDHDARVKKFVEACQIKNYVAEASPQQKKEYLAQLPAAIMVGNGFNDALAISRANVGVSVAGCNSTAYQASDVHLEHASLDRLPLSVRIARSTMRSIKSAFMFSAAYNLGTVALAFTGFLTPVTAAILMPINGMIVSAIAARRLSYERTDDSNSHELSNGRYRRYRFRHSSN